MTHLCHISFAQRVDGRAEGESFQEERLSVVIPESVEEDKEEGNINDPYYSNITQNIDAISERLSFMVLSKNGCHNALVTCL